MDGGNKEIDGIKETVTWVSFSVKLCGGGEDDTYIATCFVERQSNMDKGIAFNPDILASFDERLSIGTSPSFGMDKIAQALEITKLKQRVMRLEQKRKLIASGLWRLKKVRTAQRIESSADIFMDDHEDASKQGEIAEIDADEDVTLEEVAAEAEPAELKEVIEVVTTAKLMTEVVIAAATTITAALSAARRRKGVVIRDLEETATLPIIVHFELESKDKGKGILVEESKPLKKQAYIELDEAYARELEAELNANINWNEVIEQHFNSIVAFLEKGEEELEEEASKQSKTKSKSSEEKATKKHKLDEEVPVVDYQIHTEHNKPYYKIIRADGTHQLFLSFISLLRNFDREDLEMLWQIVQARFASSEPKNFSDDFLLNTLKTMFVEAHVWKSQRGSYGLAKVKSWKLLESCGVHIITFTTTQMILLVERRYPLTRFTLYQMLKNVRLEVEEESEMSLELLRFVRRQQQEVYRPE
nr:hypothetical protein [Tanacetum cinerariifolium]